MSHIQQTDLAVSLGLAPESTPQSNEMYEKTFL